MIGFLEQIEGALPLSDIKAIRHVERAPGKAEHYLVHRHSGTPGLHLFTWEYKDLMARPVQLMPAEAGTMLVTVYVGDGDPFADKVPILAWALCLNGIVRPVTPSGVHRDQGSSQNSTLDWHPSYIEMPNGTLYELGYEADTEQLSGVGEAIHRELKRHERYEAERAEHAKARQAAEEQAAC